MEIREEKDSVEEATRGVRGMKEAVGMGVAVKVVRVVKVGREGSQKKVKPTLSRKVKKEQIRPQYQTPHRRLTREEKRKHLWPRNQNSLLTMKVMI